MITHLSATTTARIVSELLEHSGSAGASRVLTLVIPTDAAGLEEALYAAHGASRDHPCRVIAVVAPGTEDHPGEHEADSHGHLDAEIRVGHHAGAGETLVLRPWGEAAEHTDTLVVPFLLPDVPVVVWWPTQVPAVPSEDPLGKLGTTRITNTPAQAHPDRALAALAPVWAPGDIDLAWTRITLWRAMVVTTLDALVRGEQIQHITISGQPENASVALMAAWLRQRVGVEVKRRNEQGFKGISTITAHTAAGNVVIARHDHERVTITRPGAQEPQVVTMARREPITTLNEELRRLTPDLVYREVLITASEEAANAHH